MELVGHASLVYSVDAHRSGLIASGGEDCFLKIWRGNFLVSMWKFTTNCQYSFRRNQTFDALLWLAFCFDLHCSYLQGSYFSH